jgi:hypothetical protein
MAAVLLGLAGLDALSRECLGSWRIPSLVELASEVQVRSREADRRRRRIRWRFPVRDARRKFRYDGSTTRRSKD